MHGNRKLAVFLFITCLHSATFIFVSVFSVAETIALKIWETTVLECKKVSVSVSGPKMSLAEALSAYDWKGLEPSAQELCSSLRASETPNDGHLQSREEKVMTKNYYCAVSKMSWKSHKSHGEWKKRSITPWGDIPNQWQDMLSKHTLWMPKWLIQILKSFSPHRLRLLDIPFRLEYLAFRDDRHDLGPRYNQNPRTDPAIR